MEELQARHRKEQRDLQSRITSKKKQANKKSRKGVNDECDRLEAELKEKQEGRIALLNGETVNTVDVEPPIQQLEDLSVKPASKDLASSRNGVKHDAAEEDDNDPPAAANGLEHGAKKPNRQKARLARRAAEQDEQARQAAEEARNMPDLKQQERERMLQYMKERGLQEKEIRADGHCLYSAVADQLDQLDIPLGVAQDAKAAPSYTAVRAAAADYIQQHQDDFAPFLEEPLPDYLHKIRNTGEWGGQLELMALAKTYGTNINVLQDLNRVENVKCGEPSDTTLWLGYYKHGFGLGEHYNSLRKVP